MKFEKDRVMIDGSFVAEQAKEAVRQFFKPVTAPFESHQEKASSLHQVRQTREHAAGSEKELSSKTHD
jgi:hypothetical protein